VEWLNGEWPDLGLVAPKAAGIYVIAVLLLRVGERRTLAQWTAIDFAVAVAIGAVIGRTAVAGTQSLLTGAVALAVLITGHRMLSIVRFRHGWARVTDHPVRVLVSEGRVRGDQLRRCGLTDRDLYAQLRERGVFDLSLIRYVLYEANGKLSVLREDQAPLTEVMQAGLRDAQR